VHEPPLLFFRQQFLHVTEELRRRRRNLRDGVQHLVGTDWADVDLERDRNCGGDYRLAEKVIVWRN